MANENKFDNPERDRFNALDYKGITPLDQEIESDFETETAAEIAAPVNVRRDYAKVDSDDDKVVSGGKGIGFLALALSIISLFMLPVILGAAGIIVGFIARRRGANALGAWAIGIGLVSLILGIFITPFF
ncbi:MULTISPECIES: DUF4190 domain-containing protein [Metabacillus]|jgi:hypothetical protein|uniref:DUF4190 domain-containing protein n=1 Tax=Metabacillus rhizolycopersici TaxID=2875709 RepID=A0ABS7UN79_9BACI|nr:MULTISPECIES: DUF4190 domain-containing protein [Metabacillus]MBZ5749761.1 DUF4190 domain-containing protein [Metabacillus rhizolycopersici]MCM3650486.1 DUF4190 domain-containing protein [Metabacillus litoralis]